MSSFASTSSARLPYPSFLPPSLRTLSDPRPHPNPSSLPPSSRPWTTKRGHTTLQDELDELEAEEDEFYNQMMDVRQYGYSWLVPLGRQNTHNEDAEDAYQPHALPSSPGGTHNASFDSASGGGVPFAAAQGGGGGGGGPPEAPVRDLDAEIEDADASESESEDETRSEGGSTGSERGGGATPARSLGGGGGAESAGEESMQM